MNFHRLGSRIVASGAIIGGLAIAGAVPAQAQTTFFSPGGSNATTFFSPITVAQDVASKIVDVVGAFGNLQPLFSLST